MYSIWEGGGLQITGTKFDAEGEGGSEGKTICCLACAMLCGGGAKCLHDDDRF